MAEKRYNPVLYPKQHDLARKWFVQYQVWDHARQKMRERKCYGNLNKLPTIEERVKEGARLVQIILRNQPLPNMRGARLLVQHSAGTVKTIGELLNTALKEHALKVKPKTALDYSVAIKHFAHWCDCKRLKHAQLTDASAREYLMHLVNDLHRANKTYNEHRTILKMLMKYVVRDGYITHNIFEATAPLPNRSTPFKRYHEQTEKLVQAKLPAWDEQVYLSVQLCYYCMIRPKEQAQLLMHDVDFSSGTITINARAAKTNLKRTVAIHPQLLAWLYARSYHTANPEHYLLSPAGAPGAVPCGSNYIRYRYRKFCRAHGIPDNYKLYGWKHTGNSKGAQTVPHKLMVLQNGWRNENTIQHYTSELSSDDMGVFKERFPAMGKPVQLQDENTLLKQQLANMQATLEKLLQLHSPTQNNTA